MIIGGSLVKFEVAEPILCQGPTIDDSCRGEQGSNKAKTHSGSGKLEHGTPIMKMSNLVGIPILHRSKRLICFGPEVGYLTCCLFAYL